MADFAANLFKTSSIGAAYVNPENWASKLEKALEEERYITRFAVMEYKYLGTSADKGHISKNAYETASALTEGTRTGVSALSYTGVDVTFVEYGQAYAVSEKELASTPTSVMDDVMSRIAMALSKKKEQVARDLLYANATTNSNVFYPNGHTSANIVVGDTFTLSFLIDLQTQIRLSNDEAVALFIHPLAEAQVKKILATNGSVLVQESLVGLKKGFLGNIMGTDVYSTNYITTEGMGADDLVEVVNNIMIGSRAFALVPQIQAKIRWKEDSVLDRGFTFEGHECYGMAVLNAEAIAVGVTATGVALTAAATGSEV